MGSPTRFFLNILRPSMKIVFVRHGELEGENSNILHAIDDSVSLSKKSRETMISLSSILKNLDIGMVISSPEIRTKESAEIIAKKLSRPVQYMNELQGRKWGDFAGKSWDEVRDILSTKTLEERYAFIPPQGESWKQFESRILDALHKIARNFSLAETSKNICIVSHGSAIRVLLPKIFGIPVEESLHVYPEYGSISVVEYDGHKYTSPVFNKT
ncbi:MAG: histidine phosphatase family protein, partial [Bdellovibrionales bacterium]